MKECTKCHRMLDESEFYISRKAKNGLQSYCKSCQKEDLKERMGGVNSGRCSPIPDLPHSPPDSSWTS